MKAVIIILITSLFSTKLYPQFSDTIPFQDPTTEKFGVKILSSGKILVEPKYDDLNFPEEGLLLARLDGKTGFINVNGKVVVPFKYHDANNFSDGMAAVSQETKAGWKIGFVDKSGKLVIDLKYYSIYLDRTRFVNGFAVVRKTSDECGVIDKTGKEITPFIYSYIYDFEKNITTVGKSGKWALMDKTGKELTAFKYDFLEEPYYYDEDLIKMEVAGKIGFLNYSGVEIVPPYFEEVGWFSEDLCPVRAGEKWGYIDNKGKNVLKYQFTYADIFSEGLALISYSDMAGDVIYYKYIDKTGNMIIAVKGGTPSVYANFSDGAALMIDAESKYFFINKTGSPISADRYEFAEQFSDGLASVCNEGKCGYIDNTGKVVIPLNYVAASPFFNGFATITILSEAGNEISQIIDKTGKVLGSY